MRLLYTAIVCLLFTISTLAQEKVIPYPHLSPLQTIEIPIGIANFNLTYSRPSMRGREIFGGLESYGEMWRTGANKNMKLSFDESIIINGDTLSAGTYTIFTTPETNKWTIHIYDHIDWYGVPKGIDTLRAISEFEVQPIRLSRAVESLDISFINLSYEGGEISISWENTQVIIPFIIPYDGIITQRLADQREVLASDYEYAANIYFNKKKDLDKAMEYLNLSTSTRINGVTFDQWLSNILQKDLGLPWAHMMKSKIYAARGDFKNAIQQAQLSIKIADAVESRYYQEENKSNIEKWSTK